MSGFSIDSVMDSVENEITSGNEESVDTEDRVQSIMDLDDEENDSEDLCFLRIASRVELYIVPFDWTVMRARGACSSILVTRESKAAKPNSSGSPP